LRFLGCAAIADLRYDERKQALNDMIAGTLVIRRS
jgi:hypothetical protein